ncbi:MAG TPA: sialidase family protein [Verrucomicrobiae bacterium]
MDHLEEPVLINTPLQRGEFQARTPASRFNGLPLLLAALALAMAREAACTAAEPMLQSADVFVSGAAGYSTYRIPGIETAPDGTLIAFAEARKYSAADPGFGKQDIDLVYKRSTDNGATWSSMVVLEDPGELWSAANPATLVDRNNGKVWVFYLRSRPGRSTETARPGTDDNQTIARWSADNGRTWSEPIDLTAVGRDMADTTWRASVPGPGGAIQTSKGRLLVPMWKMPFATFAIFSDDHGQTWRRGKVVAGNQGGDECQVVELADGRILMDIRQEKGATRWLAESSDGGETWADPRPGITVTPVACAIERYTLKSRGDDRDRLLWSGPKGPDRKNLVLLTSYDEGKTFTGERLVSDNFAAYSELTVLKDKTVGILWERGVERGYQFITFTRLNREWLDAPPAPSAPAIFKVISRGEAAGTYQAFPDICRLKKGDLLCVFYGGYGHISFPTTNWPKGGRVCMVRSKDEGRTWSAPRVLFDGPFDDRDPHIAQLSDGTVACTFFTYRRGADGKISCDTCMVVSTDDGQTWPAEPRVVAAGWPSSAPVRELPDGTRLLGVYREDSGTAYGGVIRSSDAGKTWSGPIPIGKDSGVRLDAETDFVRLKDGTIYAALRGDRTNTHFAISQDAGLTWSVVKDIGFPGHCPHFTRLSTGEILLCHRLPLTALHVSRDDAKTWQGPYQIDTTIGAYPSTVELKDGTVLVVYYEEGNGSAIRARRFKLTPTGIEFLPLE